MLTDYDDRPNDTMRFTWPNEIDSMDDVVDHFLEVFLAPSGEPAAPVVIARVVSDATAEWVGLRNVTRAAIELSGLRLGDEEGPGGGEGMYVLSSFSLDAGAVGFATLAASAAAFETRYGRAADVILESTSRLDGWSTGTMALSNSSDEVLLLGADNLIWDVVTYGSTTYPGVDGAARRPAADQVVARLGDDTDVMPTDFVVVPDCAAALACPGGVCQACTEFACLPTTVGTSCADADLCNGDETCDGAGACMAATPLDCDDASACATDSCEPATGCVNEVVTCADDGNPCTTPVCDPMTGCGFADVVNGTSCDDADACTTATVCADGTCGAGMAVTCADDGNDCTTERCDPTLGCLIEAAAEGSACDDGDACTSGSACSMGSCVGGMAITCADDDNPCTAPTCDAATGCGLSNVADGTACEDGSACTTSTTCSAGTCGGGSAVECPDDENPCTAPLCNPASGECGFANVADGIGCDDVDPCTAATTCTAGVCGGGDAVVCADDGNPCTAERCDPMTGCRSTAVADGAACDDADACTSGEACASGVCAGGSAVACPDDGNPCTVALCMPSTGCGVTNAADGMACDDGDPCTEGDECTAGACGGDPVPACVADAGSMDGGVDDGGVDDGGVGDGGVDDGGVDDGGVGDGGVDDGGVDDGGVGDGGVVSVDAGRGDAGGDARDAGASGGGASGGGGCGCRTDRGGDARFAWWLVGLLVFSRRRRR